MKKSLISLWIPFLAGGAAALFSLSAAEIPDLARYGKPLPQEYLSESFNAGAPAWKKTVNAQKRGFAITPHVGVMGSPALMGSIPAGSEETLPSWKVPCKVIPGRECKLSFSYRLSDFQQKEPPSVVRRGTVIVGTLHLFKPGTKEELKHFNIWIAKKTDDGQELKQFSETMIIPADASPDAEFDIHFDWWHTGTFVIDDVKLAGLGEAVELQLQSPDRLLPDETGKFVVRVQRQGKPVPKGAELLIEADGKKKLADQNADGTFSASFPDLPMGEIPVKMALFDRKGKKILAEHSLVLFRRAKTVEITKVDEYGRLVYQGKPILPIGLFTLAALQDADYRRIADAGFQFIEMSSTHSKLPPPHGPFTNTSAGTLSYLANGRKYGLKFVATVQHLNPLKESVRRVFEKGYNDAIDAPGILREFAKTLEGNPDFIGYYVADENTASELPETQKLRERIARWDQSHVTMTLSCSTDFLDKYVQTGDILLFDAYPYNAMFKPGVKGDLVATDKDFQKLAALKTSWWLTQQDFDWARHPARKMFGATDEEKRRHRIPTEEELTALKLLGVIYNAKGFFGYGYNEVFVHGEKVQPGFGEIFWPRVVSGIRLLNKLSPWILSIEKAPELTLAQKKGTVRGRIFSADGKFAVILVGICDAPHDAAFTLPAGKQFVSLTGRSVLQGKTWRFTSSGVSYDVLMEK